MTFADAVTGSDGRPLDQIRLTGVTATGHHGVLPHERAEGQTFRADVVLHLDARPAAGSDDLAATVSYAEVAEDVHDVLSGSPVDLVETLAERIAAVVLSRSAVQAVDVRVHKPQAPISVPFDDVEVVVRRDRENPPAVPAATSTDQQVSPAPAPAPAPAAAPVPAPPVPPPPAPPEPVAATPVPAATSLPTPAVAETAVPAPPAPDATTVDAAPVPGPEAPGPESAPAPPAVDPLDEVPEAPVDAVLALGANLGDAQGTLRAAVTDIDRIPGVQVMEVSPLARTVAVGPEQPDFLNAVLLVRTTLPARDLLGACQEVELLHGRVRDERWGPRTLDVDVVQYGDLTSTAEDLELPHPRARERAFVLVPWAEVDPQGVLVGLGGGPVAQLAATAPDRSGIRWLALDWLTEPASSGAVPAAPAPQAPSSQPVPAAPPSHPTPQAPSTAAFPAQAPPSVPVPRQDPPDDVPPAQEPRGFVAAAGMHAPIPPAPDAEHPERA
ncbi:2-amino-4-hydroxy-6-hydroxymethyldihydropteridine diphosphokinase [Isoptericola haloaureus]|uniref:Bifunctional folate synthesis protein n=1 Tax=Isoptericola haloaureus TaxID=1542902 RepID=A0ABU7Z550_9MICO